MRILITGANGMLAKAVRERFKDETLILTDVIEDENVKKLDITDLNQVTEFVASCKPDIIINCAAYTAVDKADVNGKIICRKMAKKNVVFSTYFLYHEFMI